MIIGNTTYELSPEYTGNTVAGVFLSISWSFWNLSSLILLDNFEKSIDTHYSNNISEFSHVKQKDGLFHFCDISFEYNTKPIQQLEIDHFWERSDETVTIYNSLL